MSKAKIHGAEYPLHKIFSNDFNFHIPMYQRPYSWTTDEAQTLFDDLYNSIGSDSKASPDGLGPYFLGSIVLIKDETQPLADVIDGQQRLTTLTLLISALRHSITHNGMCAALTNYLFESGDPVLGTQNRYRLTLRERDAEFFRTYVQEAGRLPELLQLDNHQITDSQRNIKQNAQLFLAALNAIGEGNCVRLAQYVMQQCFLVVVSTPHFDSAYRIFSILNDRGLDLSPSDILKAEIIGRVVPPTAQTKFNEQWEASEEELGRKAFAELFSHIRMIFRKQKMRESLLKEFREFVVPATKNSQEFIEKVLVPYADALGIVRSAGYQSTELAERVNGLLRWLNRIDNTDWIPAALAYVAQFKHEPKSVSRFLVDLERLAAFLMITRTGINQRLERYGKLLGCIQNNVDLYAAGSPLQLTDDEAHEFLSDINGDVYEMTSQRRLYLLLRLDSALSDGSATYDHGVISIEHVLPQAPEDDSDWCSWFPTGELRERWVHRIGNLILLTHSKNSSAKNYEFDKKKKSYFTKGGVSPFPITTQVIAESAWTLEVVERQQRQRLEALNTLWRLNVDCDEFLNVDDDPIDIAPIDPEVTTGPPARFHVDMVPQLEKHFGQPLTAGPNQTWVSGDGAIVVSCQASKKYDKSDVTYWYGFKIRMHERLTNVSTGFCAFGLGSPDRILLIPFSFFQAELNNLWISKDKLGQIRHWHVQLLEDGSRLYLARTNGLTAIDVTGYILNSTKDE